MAIVIIATVVAVAFLIVRVENHLIARDRERGRRR